MQLAPYRRSPADPQAALNILRKQAVLLLLGDEAFTHTPALRIKELRIHPFQGFMQETSWMDFQRKRKSVKDLLILGPFEHVTQHIPWEQSDSLGIGTS